MLGATAQNLSMCSWDTLVTLLTTVANMPHRSVPNCDFAWAQPVSRYEIDSEQGTVGKLSMSAFQRPTLKNLSFTPTAVTRPEARAKHRF